MRKSPNPKRMSFAEYVKAEAANEIRHEFVYGEMFAMAGGTLGHNRITRNVLGCLMRAEQGTTCQTYFTDVKVRADTEVVYYPDVAVECVARRLSDVIIDQPCVVMEVTSKSTRRVDHGEKLGNYRRIPALQLYLIVEQTRRRITRHWRDASGAWQTEEVMLSGSVDVPCLDTTMTLDEIYDGVEMPPLGVAEPDDAAEIEEFTEA